MIATLNAPREDLLTMNRYLIIIERTNTGLSAYSPDLPGCVATGAIREELEKGDARRHEFHLEGLRLEREPVPAPQSEATYCEVA